MEGGEGDYIPIAIVLICLVCVCRGGGGVNKQTNRNKIPKPTTDLMKAIKR